MDIYHIWCNAKAGTGDIAFCDAITRYLGPLRDDGLIAGFRITRRKLGLGPKALGEFHIMIETDDLAQLDRAFHRVATRAEPVESLHHGVNALAEDVVFALYRDFPDDFRDRGAEKF